MRNLALLDLAIIALPSSRGTIVDVAFNLDDGSQFVITENVNGDTDVDWEIWRLESEQNVSLLSLSVPVLCLIFHTGQADLMHHASRLVHIASKLFRQQSARIEQVSCRRGRARLDHPWRRHRVVEHDRRGCSGACSSSSHLGLLLTNITRLKLLVPWRRVSPLPHGVPMRQS
jgi:hypothetical protein